MYYNLLAKYVIYQQVIPLVNGVIFCTKVNLLINKAKYYPIHQLCSWLEYQGLSFSSIRMANRR